MKHKVRFKNFGGKHKTVAGKMERLEPAMSSRQRRRLEAKKRRSKKYVNRRNENSDS